MEPLRISINKFLGYRKLPLSLSTKFYNVVKDTLLIYNEYECCITNNSCDDNVKDYIFEKMRKYVLPDIYFKYVYFYVAMKFNCVGRDCCGTVY